MSRFSLRTRLLVAVGAVTLGALVVADVSVYVSLRNYLESHVDAQLHTSALPVAAATRGDSPAGEPPGRPPGLPNGPSSPTDFCVAATARAPGMFVEVLDSSGQIVSQSGVSFHCPAVEPGGAASLPKLPDATALQHAATSGANFTAPASSGNDAAFRVLATDLPNGRLLVIAAPLTGMSSTLSQLLLAEILVTAGALFLAVLVGLLLVRLGLRPLRDVERTAEAIAAGDLMLRVPNANERTEVGHVATALNVMLERIEAAFSELRASERRLRRFVADASHELRTPTAAVSAYAQLFHRGASANRDDLDRVMRGIERESARMSRLVEDLLTLARFDERTVSNPEVVELVGLVSEALETARTVGPRWPVGLSASDPIEVLGDPVALRQVVDNLLSNLRAHTPEGTHAMLAVSRTGAEAVIELSDDGPGLTEELARAVFERFFRADPSRSRETGGAGLGLAIVASITAAHGGRVEAVPGPELGITFRVFLPTIESNETDDPVS